MKKMFCLLVGLCCTITTGYSTQLASETSHTMPKSSTSSTHSLSLNETATQEKNYGLIKVKYSAQTLNNSDVAQSIHQHEDGSFELK